MSKESCNFMENRKTPVMVFENDSQLRECIKWWQKRLYLESWYITSKLVAPDEIEGLQGNNTFQTENKSSHIMIARLTDKQRSDSIIKTCDEETVIHELLHLKYNLVGFSEDNCSYEQCWLDMCQHQNLEEMAKTLLIVKYGLMPKWFYNRKEQLK